jgi:hypothetical protein
VLAHEQMHGYICYTYIMTNIVSNKVESVGGFKMQNMMMRYNVFMPRLYNWCLSLGFETGKIMPSRAFCSDESQGYPIIMIAKHFGTFPFNHGRVGGIVATDRHGPYSEHGQDLVIIQASHVGYDPETKKFGSYRRLQTANQGCSPNCGKIHHVIGWYQNEYLFAQQNILLHKRDGKNVIIVDNQLLQESGSEGLKLRLDRLVEVNTNGAHQPLHTLSTAKIFIASSKLVDMAGKQAFGNTSPRPLAEFLNADMFYYQRNIQHVDEGGHHLEQSLIHYMPQIVTARSPILTAAQISTQVEFDLTFRTIAKEKGYQNKNVLFISGLNIDISPQAGQLFPLTKFVPWAAYHQNRDGACSTMEQAELVQSLIQQNTENPDQIDLEAAIQIMTEAEEIIVEL